MRKLAVLIAVLSVLAGLYLWLRVDEPGGEGGRASAAQETARGRAERQGAAGITQEERAAATSAARAIDPAAAELDDRQHTPRVEKPMTGADGFAEVHVLSGEKPVAGARVVLYWMASARGRARASTYRIAGEAVTRADGVARLPARAGAYLVSAHAAPLAEAAREFVRPAGAEVTRVELTLTAAHVLEGRTLSRGTREPIAAAQVVVSQALRARAGRFGRSDELPPEERHLGESDSGGVFRVGGLAEGSYRVEASSVGHSRAVEPQVAVPRPGQLVLELPAAAVIEGKVLASDGSPASGAEVIANSATPFGSPAAPALAVAAQGGGFSLEVEPGSHHLSARRGGEAGAQGAPISVAAGGTVRGVVLQLGAPAAIAGSVVAQSTGRPLPGAQVTLTVAQGASVAGAGVTDQSGAFAIEGLAPGSFDAAAHADGYLDTVRRGLTVTGGQRFPLVVALSGTGGVSGVVRDAAGRPVPGALVRVTSGPGGFGGGGSGAALSGQALSSGAPSEAMTDGAGVYLLSGLPAGPARLAASRDAASSGPTNSAVIVEGAQAALDFTLADNGLLSGHVARKTGQPIDPGTSVRAVQDGMMGAFQDGSVIAMGDVDPAGAYQLSLPPGHYRLSANPPTQGAMRRPQPTLVTVEVSQPAQQDLQIDDTVAGTTGSVLEPSGAPSAGARVVLLSASRQLLGAALCDGDGRFNLLQFRGAQPAFVRARNGGRLGEVPVAQAAADTSVTLQPAATLHGTVASGSAPPGSFSVTLTAADPLSALVGPGGGPDGSQEFTGSKFDLYDALALEVTVVVKTDDGRSGSAPASLKPGQEAQLTIPLQDSASVTGRVMQGAQPASGAVLLLDGSARAGGSSITGKDGRFALKNLTAGDHSLVVRAGGYVAPARTFTLTPAQALDLGDLALQAPRAAPGTLGVTFFASGTGVAMGRIVPAGPADLAGVQEGDLVLSIDGVGVQGVADAQAHSLGAPLAPAQVTLQRAGARQSVQIIRAGN